MAPLLDNVFKINSESVSNGFKACGLYPFNPDTPDYSKCLEISEQDLDNEEISKEYAATIVQYIQLISYTIRKRP